MELPPIIIFGPGTIKFQDQYEGEEKPEICFTKFSFSCMKMRFSYMEFSFHSVFMHETFRKCNIKN